VCSRDARTIDRGSVLRTPLTTLSLIRAVDGATARASCIQLEVLDGQRFATFACATIRLLVGAVVAAMRLRGCPQSSAAAPANAAADDTLSSRLRSLTDTISVNEAILRDPGALLSSLSSAGNTFVSVWGEFLKPNSEIHSKANAAKPQKVSDRF
jgi:hypothetical protein